MNPDISLFLSIISGIEDKFMSEFGQRISLVWCHFTALLKDDFEKRESK